MVIDNNILAKKAKATTDFLIQGVLEAELIENICLEYVKICEHEKLKHLKIKPRELTQDDIKRILFEIICFAAYIIMGQEVPKYIVRRRFLLGRIPYVEGIRYYNTRLLECLEEHFDNQKLRTIREIVMIAVTPDIKFGFGEPLNITERIATYIKCESSLKAAELFAQHYFPYAIDPENLAILQISSMKFIETVVDLVRLVLNAVFEDKSIG